MGARAVRCDGSGGGRTAVHGAGGAKTVADAMERKLDCGERGGWRG